LEVAEHPDFAGGKPGGFPIYRPQWAASRAISGDGRKPQRQSRHQRERNRCAAFPSMGATALAPGIFGLAGVFTDPQFQVCDSGA